MSNTKRLTPTDWKNPKNLLWEKLKYDVTSTTFRVALRNALVKLCEYEDLEEHNKLVKLPIGIGDTVWKIEWLAYPCSVKGIEYDEHWCVDCEYKAECTSTRHYYPQPKVVDWRDMGYFMQYEYDLFGKIIFTSEEDAIAECERLNSNFKKIGVYNELSDV